MSGEGVWVCGVCTLENDANKLRCLVCDSWAPEHGAEARPGDEHMDADLALALELQQHEQVVGHARQRGQGNVRMSGSAFPPLPLYAGERRPQHEEDEEDEMQADLDGSNSHGLRLRILAQHQEERGLHVTKHDKDVGAQFHSELLARYDGGGLGGFELSHNGFTSLRTHLHDVMKVERRGGKRRRRKRSKPKANALLPAVPPANEEGREEEEGEEEGREGAGAGGEEGAANVGEAAMGREDVFVVVPKGEGDDSAAFSQSDSAGGGSTSSSSSIRGEAGAACNESDWEDVRGCAQPGALEPVALEPIAIAMDDSKGEEEEEDDDDDEDDDEGEEGTDKGGEEGKEASNNDKRKKTKKKKRAGVRKSPRRSGTPTARWEDVRFDPPPLSPLEGEVGRLRRENAELQRKLQTLQLFAKEQVARNLELARELQKFVS